MVTTNYTFSKTFRLLPSSVASIWKVSYIFSKKKLFLYYREIKPPLKKLLMFQKGIFRARKIKKVHFEKRICKYRKTKNSYISLKKISSPFLAFWDDWWSIRLSFRYKFINLIFVRFFSLESSKYYLPECILFS